MQSKFKFSMLERDTIEISGDTDIHLFSWTSILNVVWSESSSVKSY
jgi:hypothetical protein